jgi:hypothetical protein
MFVPTMLRVSSSDSSAEGLDLSTGHTPWVVVNTRLKSVQSMGSTSTLELSLRGRALVQVVNDYDPDTDQPKGFLTLLIVPGPRQQADISHWYVHHDLAHHGVAQYFERL